MRRLVWPLTARVQDTDRAIFKIAAGTVFLDVLIWQLPELVLNELPAATCHTMQPPLLRLRGHEGSIHRVAWAPSGDVVASASDDRSLRVWGLPLYAIGTIGLRGS